MPDRDKLQGFIFDQFDIRGEILTLEQSYGEAIARGNYPQLIKHLLGEFMAAAGMLSATLKFDGTKPAIAFIANRVLTQRHACVVADLTGIRHPGAFSFAACRAAH